MAPSSPDCPGGTSDVDHEHRSAKHLSDGDAEAGHVAMFFGFKSHGGSPKSSKSWMTILVLKLTVLGSPKLFQETPMCLCLFFEFFRIPT